MLIKRRNTLSARPSARLCFVYCMIQTRSLVSDGLLQRQV